MLTRLKRSKTSCHGISKIQNPVGYPRTFNSAYCELLDYDKDIYTWKVRRFIKRLHTVDVNSQLPVTFSLAAAPNGMTIDEAGVINWIPTSTQLGTHDVLMIVSNELGFDEQEYVITVNAIPSDIINFNSLTFQSYGGQDTAKGSVSILDGGTTLKLVGNRWRAVNFNYIISPNSVLEFELKSSVVSEIHGIGLDNNLTLDPSTTFNLFGTQTYGLMNYRYSGSVNYQYFSIPIGQFFNGSMNYLSDLPHHF
jgi:hypothetical protein